MTASVLVAPPSSATEIVTVPYGGITLPYLGTQPFYSAGTTTSGIPAFYESGQHSRYTSKIVQKARSYMRAELHRLPRSERGHVAAVFDIDDTLLSNYSAEAASGFTLSTLTPNVLTGSLPPIPQTVRLFKWLQRQGVQMHCITGRESNTADATYTNFARVGLTGKLKIHFKPVQYANSYAETYKTKVRKDIERRQRILINVGDQYSDLKGGHAKRAYKIPNPMYFIP